MNPRAYSGIRRASLTLLPAALAVVAYGFIGFFSAKEGIEGINEKTAPLHTRLENLKLELASTDPLRAHFEKCFERLELLSNLDTKKQPTISVSEIDGWRSAIASRRFDAKRAQGEVSQFDAATYPHLYKQATAIADLLKNEGEVWSNSEKFIELQADSSTAFDTREAAFEKWNASMEEVEKQRSSFGGALKSLHDELTRMEHEDTNALFAVIHELQQHQKRLSVHMLLLVCGVVAVIGLGIGIVGFSGRKGEPSQIVLP